MPTPGWIDQTAPLLSVNVPPLNAVTEEPAEVEEPPDADEEDDDDDDELLPEELVVVEEVVDEPAIVGAED
jgi:hypothetical protein